ncbi:MAG: family 1 glycosylhydrolase [Bacteroidota bacterium]
MIKSTDFGNDFLWGIATAATQIEGAASTYGLKKTCETDVLLNFFYA